MGAMASNMGAMARNMGAMVCNMGAMASNMVNASFFPDGAPFFLGRFHWIVFLHRFFFGGVGGFERPRKGSPFMEIRISKKIQWIRHRATMKSHEFMTLQIAYSHPHGVPNRK